MFMNLQPDAVQGFLAPQPPLQRLSSAYHAWDEVAAMLPNYLASGRVRQFLDEIPMLDVENITTRAELERSMLLLSYFGHAYIWGQDIIADMIPENIAVPWCNVAEKLHRPPVLSYASQTLNNWGVFDPTKPLSMDNLYKPVLFYGGFDEVGFHKIHILIEKAAAPAVYQMHNLQKAVINGDNASIIKILTILYNALKQMTQIFEEVTKLSDPHCYYLRVRKFLHGWVNNPVFQKGGVIYQGVKKWKEQPMQFRGETAAQSSVIPGFDIVLDIEHDKQSILYQYLLNMRDYMPKDHREFLVQLHKKSVQVKLKSYVQQYKDLTEAYNDCLSAVIGFRQLHYRFVHQYVVKQAERFGSPTNYGTGGTSIIEFLPNNIRNTYNTQVKQD